MQQFSIHKSNYGLLKKLAFVVIFMVFALSFLDQENAFAEYYYNNFDTNYEARIIDDADLLSENEKEKLLNVQMTELTEYTNVLLVTINENTFGYSETSPKYELDYCSSVYDKYYSVDENGKYENCIIFLIDMDTRWLYLYREGDIKKQISSSICDIITDNCYSYASGGNYAKCSRKCFSQVTKVIKGQKIAKPMKTISNLFIAFSFGFLLTFIYASRISKARKASNQALLDGAINNINIGPISPSFIKTTKVYHEPPHVSGGGGGGGSHSSGGGSHGGGGGHRF